MTSTLLAVFALLIGAKGLGGSFNALFINLGLGLYHGPVIGGLFGLLMASFFLTFTGFEKQHVLSVSLREKKIFSLIYFAMISVALIVRWQWLRVMPMDIQRADMLFAVQAEMEAFLNGVNPYGPVVMPNGGVVQHGYPPMLWLGYLPLYVLKLDLRYLNLFAQFIYYLFFWDIFLRQDRFHFSNFTKSSLFFLILAGLHCFSKQAVRQPADVHMGSYWLCFTLFLWALSYEKFGLAFWILPLLCLCREPAVLWVAPLLFYLFLENKGLFWSAIKKVGIGIAIVAGPFILWSPKLFFSGILFYGQHVYQTPLNEMLRFYGLSGVLALNHLLILQKPFQALGLLIGLILVFKRKENLSLPCALGLGGLAYLSLMLFVSLSYPFVYSELILLVYALLFWPRGNAKLLEAKAG